MLKLKILPSQIPNDCSIYKIAKEYTPKTWEKIFMTADSELSDVSEILQNEKILPNKENIFKAFYLTPLDKVKVVIFGQDPYHGLLANGEPQATGLSFSVPRTAPIPSSLKNIFKELNNSVPNFVAKHGDLTQWALQGVLLLNNCLSVRQGEPDCHKQIWQGFIKKVILGIIDINPNCIFVLWGKNAQQNKKFIGQRGIILESVHPSGLSANRGFFGCNHFNKINEILEKKGDTPINWNIY